MKETVKTSRSAGYLEKIFRALNDDWFSSEIDMPIITIQSTPRAYGHVSVYKIWKRNDGEEQHELNIGAGTLSRPIENLVATMMHEMCHLYNMKHNIKDTSRNGAYHNKAFRDCATTHGLLISHDSSIGWSITEPAENLIEYIIEKGWDEIHMNRQEGFSIGGGNGGKGTAGPIGKRPTSTRKLQCPNCGNSVRATKSVRIMCMDCNEQMLEV